MADLSGGRAAVSTGGAGPTAAAGPTRHAAPPTGVALWSTRWWSTAGFAALGASFTVVYLLRGGGLVQDDLSWAAFARFDGISRFEANITHRPIEGLYHWLIYTAFEDWAAPHLLLLAGLNALVAVMVWRLARSHLPVRYAWLVALVWAVLPNRSATRYWAASAPVMIGMALMLGALTVALSDRSFRRRAVVSIALVLAAMVTYEGTIFLNAAVIVVLAWREQPIKRRLVVGFVGLNVIAAAGLWSLANSKRAGANDPTAALDRLVPTQLGAGLFPEAIAPYGPLLLALVVFVGVRAWFARGSLPLEERLIGLGFVVWGLGLLPFVLTAFPLGSSGVNDRSNVLAGLGIALVVAGGIGLVARAVEPIAVALAVVVLVVFAAGAADDMNAYLRAVEDGKEFAERIRAEPPQPGPVLVVPETPNRGGVTYAYSDVEYQSAVSLAHPDGLGPGRFGRPVRTDW
jgi:hypothetical protein